MPGEQLRRLFGFYFHFPWGSFPCPAGAGRFLGRSRPRSRAAQGGKKELFSRGMPRGFENPIPWPFAYFMQTLARLGAGSPQQPLKFIERTAGAAAARAARERPSTSRERPTASRERPTPSREHHPHPRGSRQPRLRTGTARGDNKHSGTQRVGAGDRKSREAKTSGLFVQQSRRATEASFASRAGCDRAPGAALHVGDIPSCLFSLLFSPLFPPEIGGAGRCEGV